MDHQFINYSKLVWTINLLNIPNGVTINYHSKNDMAHEFINYPKLVWSINYSKLVWPINYSKLVWTINLLIIPNGVTIKNIHFEIGTIHQFIPNDVTIAILKLMWPANLLIIRN
jgi:hypothetical protein